MCINSEENIFSTYQIGVVSVSIKIEFVCIVGAIEKRSKSERKEKNKYGLCRRIVDYTTASHHADFYYQFSFLKHLRNGDASIIRMKIFDQSSS